MSKIDMSYLADLIDDWSTEELVRFLNWCASREYRVTRANIRYYRKHIYGQ